MVCRTHLQNCFKMFLFSAVLIYSSKKEPEAVPRRFSICSNMFLKNFMGDYFSGSFQKMVSFFMKQNDIKLSEMEQLMKHMEENESTEDDSQEQKND